RLHLRRRCYRARGLGGQPDLRSAPGGKPIRVEMNLIDQSTVSGDGYVVEKLTDAIDRLATTGRTARSWRARASAYSTRARG
ncbi:MAG: hypothetical protein ACXW3P_03460, partial [Rhodospirillales bacterium]